MAPANADLLPIRAGELPWLRHAVRELATEAGLSRERVRELVLAVNEIATNTLMHTAGPGTMAFWREDGRVVCEVRDTGRLTDFLAGRHHPDVDSARGRGLWMANHLCDLVQIRSDSNGTVVRLTVDVSS